MTYEQTKFFFLGYLTAWMARVAVFTLRSWLEMRSERRT